MLQARETLRVQRFGAAAPFHVGVNADTAGADDTAFENSSCGMIINY